MPANESKTVAIKLTHIQQPFLVLEFFLHLVKVRPISIDGDQHSLYVTFSAKHEKRVRDAYADLILNCATDEPWMKVYPVNTPQHIDLGPTSTPVNEVLQ